MERSGRVAVATCKNGAGDLFYQLHVPVVHIDSVRVMGEHNRSRFVIVFPRVHQSYKRVLRPR